MVDILPTTAQRVARDTFLIPTFAPEPSGAFVTAHSLVIRGAKPIIVDTGCSLVREHWLGQAFGVVDPADVRWIFLSHDDHDHLGNLAVVLDACPRATLVANFSIVSRLAGDFEFPLHRVRWMDAGGSFDAGDRTLRLIRPPLFDSPATRGLHDSATGVLWAVDSFGHLVPGEVYDADDVPADLYAESFAVLNSWNTPWLEWVDVKRFAAHLRQSAALPITAIASAHGAVHRGTRIADAFERTLDLAARPAVPTPGHEVLDALLATALDPSTAPA